MSLAIEDRHAQCRQAYNEIINGQLPALFLNSHGLGIQGFDVGLAFRRAFRKLKRKSDGSLFR